MNNNFKKFLSITSFQSFVATLYGFGFMILFYQITHSLVISSTLTTVKIIASRSTSIMLVPKLKYKNPLIICRLMNLLTGLLALLAIPVYSIVGQNISFYFILAVILSIFEQIDNTFQYPMIPSLVSKEYLFKANSLNAIIGNITSLSAPFFSYFFYRFSDLRYFLFIYGFICIVSSILLKTIKYDFKIESHTSDDTSIKNEWIKTLKIIRNNKNILFCISIGVCINLIFCGINGPVLLSMGELAINEVFGQTLIKVLLSAGSIIGIWAVFKLKVKENYSKYINISTIGLLITLFILSISSNVFILYGSFTILAIFIMFIMNSTGSLLQLATPKEELSSIYTFRSTLYSIVVPLSYMIAGFILQYLGRTAYFFFSIILLLLTMSLKWIFMKNNDITYFNN